jgi:hypothetical protein
LKLLEEKISKLFQDIGTGKYFLNIALIAQEIRRIDKWDFINLKSFYILNETIITVMTEATEAI